MKRVILILGGLIVIAGLAGAAFVGMQLLNTGARASAGGGGGLQIVADDGNGAFSVNINFTPAPELPDRPADVAGVFVQRRDNTVFVGTGDIELNVEDDGSGQPEVSVQHSGPEVEVVISHDTTIYRDITEFDIEPSARQSGELTVQQVVERDTSAAGIGDNTELQVWGERRGDRVIAEVLVYKPAGWFARE